MAMGNAPGVRVSSNESRFQGAAPTIAPIVRESSVREADGAGDGRGACPDLSGVFLLILLIAMIVAVVLTYLQ
jgi:hypothetical protein